MAGQVKRFEEKQNAVTTDTRQENSRHLPIGTTAVTASAAYSARQVRQDLAASGRYVARIIDGRMGGDLQPSHPAPSRRRESATSLYSITLGHGKARG